MGSSQARRAVAPAFALRRLYEPDEAFRALLREGRALGDAGDFAAAERIFQDALLAVRGVNRANETYVLALLMTIYQRSWRTFEALALGRLLADRLTRAGETAKAAGCLATYASCYMSLAQRDAAEAALEELGALLRAVPVEANTMAHETYHYLVSALAARHGQIERARDALKAFRAVESVGESRAWRKPMQDAYLQGLIALSANAPDEARVHLGKAHDLTPERESRFEKRRAALEAQLMQGDRTGALAAAVRLLDDLSGAVNQAHTASLRIELGTWLALWIDNHGGEIRYVHRAYDLAAAAVIERICQLDRALADMPELGAGGRIPLAELAKLRKGFIADQQELMRRVGEFLLTTDGGVAADVLYGSHTDGYVRVCAWCESVSSRERHRSACICYRMAG